MLPQRRRHAEGRTDKKAAEELGADAARAPGTGKDAGRWWGRPSSFPPIPLGTRVRPFFSDSAVSGEGSST